MYRLSALRRVFRSGESKAVDVPVSPGKVPLTRQIRTPPATSLMMFSHGTSRKLQPPYCASFKNSSAELRSAEGGSLSRVPSADDRGNSYAFDFVKPQPSRPLAEPMKAGGKPQPPSSKASTMPPYSRDEDRRDRDVTSSSSYSSISVSDGTPKPSTKPAAQRRRVKPANEGLRLRRKPNLNDFTLIRVVGTGSFGRVFLGVVKRGSDVTSGTDDAEYAVAIKRLSKTQLIKQKQVAHVLSEKDILTKINHPFMVRMFGTFQDLKYLYIVMDYVEGGEFFTYLRRRKRLENDPARFYAAQVVTIFEYLHTKMIVYRDLKPENLLMGQDGYLRLTDFGFAKVVESRTYTLCGTPEYIAPEVLNNKGHGFSVDWWTLGILIYEMLAGYPPFVSEDPLEIYKKIRAGRVFYPEHIEKAAKSLIKHLLVVDISKRSGHVRKGRSDVRLHRWLRDVSFTDLLQRKIVPPYKPHVKSAVDSDNFGDYSEKAGSDDSKIPGSDAQELFRDW